MAEQVLPRLRRPGAADPQGQRQDRHPALGRGLLDLQRLGRGRGPARRRRGRLHALRRLAPPGRGPRPAASGSARTATASACRWSIWAYPRGAAIDAEGRPATPSTRSTTRRGWRWRWAPTSSSSTCPKIDPEKDKDAPAPYNEMDVTQEEAIRQCVESAGRSLVVLSGGSKIDDETVLGHTRDDHGGGRLGRDLRPQRLAARVERGARDHRPDQGDPARHVRRIP